MVCYGWELLTANFLERTRRLGLELLQRAVSLNDEFGVYYLGMARLSAIGTFSDRIETVQLFKRASKLCYSPVMTQYGHCCEIGWEIHRNIAKAIKDCRKTI
jgi:TPR repeat protein